MADDEAHKRAEELQLKEKAELEQRLSRPRWKPKDYKRLQNGIRTAKAAYRPDQQQTCDGS
jgi:hypothetical protein